jgi:hypothetical protein
MMHREVKEQEKDKRVASIEELTIQGGLSKEAVLQALEKNLPELHKCLSGNGSGKKLVLQLIVSPGGRIKSLMIVGNAPNKASAERCILEKIKEWQLPVPKDGKEARVTLTLMFAA